jgi:hypothetical protein
MVAATGEVRRASSMHVLPEAAAALNEKTPGAQKTELTFPITSQAEYRGCARNLLRKYETTRFACQGKNTIGQLAVRIEFMRLRDGNASILSRS